jgi:predicted nucleotide-binding protein
MAKMPVEIAIIGDVPTNEVDYAIRIGNSLQEYFLFSRLKDSLEQELKILHSRHIDGTEFFQSLQQRIQGFQGFHPFLIALGSSKLKARLKDNVWDNLFDVHRDAVAIFTTYGVTDSIIPQAKISAYFLYYIARLSLNFCYPTIESHPETNDCAFDFMENKGQIVRSMRAGAICDTCRNKILGGRNVSHEQINALNFLFSKAGEILSQEVERQPKPRVFVGSSVEGLTVARAIQTELNYDYHTEVWNQSNVFMLGTATLEALENALDEYDYAIFVFTPDDQIEKRNDLTKVARDNVIFEAGLFIGRKGRFKAFIVHPRDLEIQLPSDLLGIGTAKYEAKAPNLSASVGAACQKIRSAIADSRNALRS